MAMGFAMAMGLQPEQGIIASAVAGIIGGIFGGSKYQVYGPTAAFIPVIGALITKYGVASGGDRAAAHGFLVLCSVCAGVILLVLALLGMGRYAQKVPKSIVMGFTIGISITIAFSSIGEALGLTHEIHGDFVHKLALIWEHLAEFNGYACCLALLTFGMARYLLRLSIFIPAPLLALGLCTMLAETVFAGKGISLVADRYGHISTSRLVFTPPCLPPVTGAMILDLSYFVLAIVFVSGVESLLCSSLADQMANNRRTQYSPDKEFWGQGLMQILTPLINGFPCTGALARTAISINVGAVSPLGGLQVGARNLLCHFSGAAHRKSANGVHRWDLAVGGMQYGEARRNPLGLESQSVPRVPDGLHSGPSPADRLFNRRMLGVGDVCSAPQVFGQTASQSQPHSIPVVISAVVTNKTMTNTIGINTAGINTAGIYTAGINTAAP